MKRWNLILPFVVLAVVAIIFAIKREELGNFVQTIRGASLVPFAIAFACLFGRYFSHAFAYKGVFKCVGEKVPYLHIIPLVFSVTFANDCAPTAGMAGSALIAAWSHKQGLNMGKSVTVVFIEKIGYFSGFAVVMFVGFAILLATGQMAWYLVLGGVAIGLMIGGTAFILWLGYGHVETELKLFSWAERLVNRVLAKIRKKPLEPWAERMAASFHEAASIAVARPKTLVTTFLRMVMLHASDCCCFIFSGLTFGFTNLPLLMATYVAGFVIATFVLQTIGAVEVLIGLILAAYGATAGQAAAIAICYRGLIFWVPFIIGAVCINFTGSQRQTLAGDSSVLSRGAEQNAVKVELAAAKEQGSADGKAAKRASKLSAHVFSRGDPPAVVPPAALAQEQKHAEQRKPE